MNMATVAYWLPILALITSACSGDQTNTNRSDSTSQPVAAQPAAHIAEVSYRFEQPDVSVELHDDLAEISALSLFPDGRLGAVQDERGIVFVMDRTTGEIVERRSFGDNGDYEGIEHVDDRVYVLRSDGTLIEMSGWSGDDTTIRTIETPLRAKNDTEGLAYDAASNRLLIVCKADPGSGLDDGQKAVYAFDLGRDVFIEEPVYVIDADEVEDRTDGKGKFKPSALAVHPSSNALYILSSTSRSMVVLNEDGGIEQVHTLSEDLFEQPEALAFLPDGTLYIASEGGKDAGMLYAFSLRNGGR